MMKKAYLLDTNLTSALWDENNPRNEEARNFVNGLGESIIYISRFVIAEILYGHKVHESSDTTRRQKIETTMRAFPLVKDVNEHTTEPYSDIRAALFKEFAPIGRKGRIKKLRPESLVDETTSAELQIEENDLWMAAIAVQYNMTFVSEDKMSRLKQVWPALDIIKWISPPTPSN